MMRLGAKLLWKLFGIVEEVIKLRGGRRQRCKTCKQRSPTSDVEQPAEEEIIDGQTEMSESQKI